MSYNKVIQLFEHDKLKIGDQFQAGNRLFKFDQKTFSILEKHFGDKGVDYYKMINKGVLFCEFVGVIQAGDITIEVLPKADKLSGNYTEDKNLWQKVLINMLRTCGNFEVKAPTSSSLTLKPNSILDLYFEYFLKEVEYLLHTGLVKKYRKVEGNLYALKGSLNFSKNIQQNHIHQERFYVRYTTYDTIHKLHMIIYKALKLLMLINRNSSLQSRICSLMLNFPEMPDIKVNEKTFSDIVYNRKTEDYRTAIQIAKLLLLQYHPDLKGGREDVLALMFDMNKLWEKFVYLSLRRNLKEHNVREQVYNKFWKQKNTNLGVGIKPDIVIDRESENCIVLDTKWKNNSDGKPNSGDLHQLFTYSRFFDAKKVALVYPGIKSILHGEFLEDNSDFKRACSEIFIEPELDVRHWQERIAEQVKEWM